MLAKQVWRMISDPESFLARIYKGRYFKHSDILEAGIGSNPSFIWRSLCWSRDLLDAGLCWNVGTGDSIQIYKDAWITSLETRWPSSRIASGSTISRFLLPIVPGMHLWLGVLFFLLRQMQFYEFQFLCPPLVTPVFGGLIRRGLFL